MDRNEALDGARELAAQIVAADGIDGDARQRFYTEADAAFGSQLGSAELVRIFAVASGLDPKTGLPPGIGDKNLQPPHTRD